jgi:1-acyl-sn-glycerol-3-phosphate acyltransferase
VAGIGLRWLGPGFMLAYGRIWARLVLGGLRCLCGISWKITGRENLPAQGPALIAPMHQSTFDVLIWIVLAPRFAYVMKQELLRIPLFGALVRAIGVIAVDRSAGATAMRGLLRDADKAMADRRQIIIFPEGTRTPPGARSPLQPGIAALASRTNLQVIPVATDSGLRWGRHAFLKRAGTIHVAIQPPIPAGLPRAELMRRLEGAFDAGAGSLGLARSDVPVP